MSFVRACAFNLPEVWNLPDLFSQARRQWDDSWRPQSELVKGP
jgi:hypothetical protein